MKFNDQTRTFIGRLYSKLFLIVSILFVAGFAQNALAQGSKESQEQSYLLPTICPFRA